MVPVVGAGLTEGGKPEGVDAKIFQVWKFFHDGAEVSAQEFRLKPVRGREARKPVNQYLIDNCVLKPVGRQG